MTGDTRICSREISFDTGGLMLRGERWDGERGGHVILLHGGGQTRHAWRWSAERLANEGWSVTTVDLRGHGDSDWADDGDYRLARHARDLEVVTDGLDVRPVVVGASLGGLTALTLQAQRPVARALVLVDIVPRQIDRGTSRIVKFMNGHLDGFESLDDVAHAIARYKAQPVRQAPSSLRRVVRQRPDGRWYWHWDPQIMDLGSGREHGHDLLTSAEDVVEPILVVRGLQSEVVSAAQVQEFLRHAPTASSVDVAGVGHMVAGDNNHPFYAAIADFLDSLS